MAVSVSPPSAAALDEVTAGGGHDAHGVLVALAFAHAHEWIQDEGMIGLFHCADPSCDGHAVCPGCLNSIDVAFHAPLAGLVVYWCVVHVRGGRRPGRKGHGRVAR